MVKFRCRSQTIPKKEGLSMDSLHSLALERNRQMKINFDGGDLSSDADLLLVKATFGWISRRLPWPAGFTQRRQRFCQAGALWAVRNQRRILCYPSEREQHPTFSCCGFQQDISSSSFAAAVHTRMNSMKPWKTSVDCVHSWNDEPCWTLTVKKRYICIYGSTMPFF